MTGLASTPGSRKRRAGEPTDVYLGPRGYGMTGCRAWISLFAELVVCSGSGPTSAWQVLRRPGQPKASSRTRMVSTIAAKHEARHSGGFAPRGQTAFPAAVTHKTACAGLVMGGAAENPRAPRGRQGLRPSHVGQKKPTDVLSRDGDAAARSGQSASPSGACARKSKRTEEDPGRRARAGGRADRQAVRLGGRRAVRQADGWPVRQTDAGQLLGRLD